MTIKRKVGSRTVELGPLGPDIDLDEEEVYLPDGTRLTEAAATEMGKRMVEEFERRRGQPSLTGERAPTPNLTIRVPPDVRSALQSIADAQGRRLADVGRDALAEYVRRESAGAARKAPAKKVPAAAKAGKVSAKVTKAAKAQRKVTKAPAKATGKAPKR